VSRRLASIRIVSELRPIPGADLIELAIVDGWQCVVKKGEFSPGDRCAYLEIDSVLPVRPEYEFLRKACHRRASWLPDGEGFRIKTVKLRGQISQGLALPVGALDSLDAAAAAEGDDITEALGVVLWDPPLNLPAQARGNFPAFIPKTDQERAQNCLRKLAEATADHLFEATLKLDGSSCTIYAKDGALGVCSRNLDLDLSQEGNAFVDMGRKVGDRILSLGRNLAFQGELMGPGIQGNREGFTEFRWFVFDVWDIDAARYLSAHDRRALVEQLGLEHVPVVNAAIYATRHSLDDLLAFSDAQGSLGHEIAEGVVYKSHLDPSVSFKVIANRFLLRCES